MTGRWKTVLGVGVSLLTFSVGEVAFAITDEEIFRDLRFNFINPGARSLAMGGAFISIADDATAAQSNPACLSNLTAPQFFTEVRATSVDPTTTVRNFRSDLVPEAAYDVFVDTTPDDIVSPSFISYVARWSSLWFGVSRQDVINVRNRTLATFDSFADADRQAGAGSIDLDLVNWNISLAARLHRKLSAGLTLSYGQMSLESAIVNTYSGGADFPGTTVEMFRTFSDGDDSAITFTAGLLWSVTDRIAVGAVYRQGGDFTVDETLVGEPRDPDLRPGRIAEEVFFKASDTLLTPENRSVVFPNEIHIPDVIGLGVSWIPVDNLTLSLDASHITYSDLVEDFDSRLNVLTIGFSTEEEAAFTVDDQTNLHFGLEYQFATRGKTVWALRGGYRQDKDSRIRSDFAPGGFGLDENDNFPPGEDDDHFALGVGFATAGNFQLDLAGDFWSRGSEIVLSVIYSFGD